MSFSSQSSCLAISGGVGGAKLALGLAHMLEPGKLTITGNTGDDFVHLGFFISPDLDTVMYTLADLNNKDLGWGQEGESWNFLDAVKRMGGESWFRLGDRDIGTHVVRTQMLAAGKSLSEVTSHFCKQLAIKHRLVPMTDDPVATIVHTRAGEKLAFQHYFVRDECRPEVTGFVFSGIDEAKPAPGFIAALVDPTLAAVIICPSNPFVSVDPVLKVPGVMDALNSSKAAVIAVSPIVGGQALKGPAAKMMAELGMPQTALAVAEHYATQYPGQVHGFVLDEQDRGLRDEVESLGLSTIVTNTVMVTLQDRMDLAEAVLDFSSEIT
ncbi:MAG: 2-phospho-L-lactate transferase [Gammaproteobacteria bacterium]|nr:2-phospho-L-lactate transferase [Gammaproteobacteria bacterium]